MSLDLTVYTTPKLDQCLHAIVVHRMLTVDQLHRLVTPDATVKSTYNRLQALEREGVVRSLPIAGPKRRAIKVWLPTQTGVDRALQDPDLHRRHVPNPSTHRSLVAHTLAVNEVGLAFVEAARDHPGHECDPLAWEHEVAHQLSSNQKAGRLITDAVLSYLLPAGHGATLARRFIELDRATEPVHVLHDKLRRYAQYRAYRPTGPAAKDSDDPYWTRRYASWPAVCVVIGANPAKPDTQIRRRVHMIASLAAQDPIIGRQQLAIYIASFEDVVEHGPFANVWWLPGADTPVSFTGEAV